MNTRTPQNQATAHAGLACGVNTDPYRWHVLVAVPMLVLTLPAIIVLIVLSLPVPPEPPAHPWAHAASLLGVEPSDISDGRTTYIGSCALCHGKTADGVPRLGKPLRNSAFIQEHSDDDLFNLIANGRMPNDEENTTGAVMPARANQGLTDSQINDVVVYLRAIQDPSQPTASIDAWIIESTDAGTQMAGVAGGIAHDLFVASCSACHGAQGEGMEGLGKPLATSQFVEGKTDEELVAFVKSGRPIWDAQNTTGLDMPSKGGNPALTDEQLAEIVTYIRSLHE